MNVLILSVGTRNKIIQYFKKELNGKGKVICTDMSEHAPAIYEADKFYIVPRITDPNYISIILDVCKKENVSAVLSLIDPELSLLAKNKSLFENLGVKVVCSNFDLCELSLNKFEMYKWLNKNGFKTAKTYKSINDFYKDLECGDISFPVIVKPICGSASITVTKVYDKQTIELLFRNDGLMIQECLVGQEIGADVYVDAVNGNVVSIFTKKKLLMRAGETDKAVSFKDEKLFALIEKFVATSGFVWQIDIDIFEVNGEYYILEVNPRFGGGYPHAYECGCNHIKMIINNVDNIENKKNIGAFSENIYMMKYNDILIK